MILLKEKKVMIVQLEHFIHLSFQLVKFGIWLQVSQFLNSLFGALLMLGNTCTHMKIIIKPSRFVWLAKEYEF